MLGDQIRRLREASGLSMAEMARTIGVNRSTHFRYEAGERTPDVATLNRILDAVGASPEQRLAVLEAGRDHPSPQEAA